MMADLISPLPDEVICHILSVLPTEDAFTTSVLSKRWWLLCLLVPNPNVDDQRFLKSGESYSSFMNMVYVSIFARSVHCPIKRIRLRCGGFDLLMPLKTWLTAPVERGMDHLELQLAVIPPLPSFIFSLTTLSVLKLKAINVVGFSIINFPVLKILHLNQVHFFERCSFVEFLNCCPILVDFEAKNTTFGGWSLVDDEEFGKSTSLPKLVMANIAYLSNYEGNFVLYDNDYVPLQAFCNAKFLRLDKIHGNVPVFSNLTHLELVYATNIDWSLVFKVLNSCPKLQNFLLDKSQLLISLGPLGPFSFYPRFVPDCLYTQFKKCTITNYTGEKYECQFVEYILQNSTSLSTMTIYSPPSLKSQDKLEMITELSSCPKSSAICEISFK